MTAHAKDADALALSSAALLTVALVAVWTLGRQNRWSSPVSRIVAVALALSGLAVLATTWTTLSAALDAVWMHHPSWKA